MQAVKSIIFRKLTDADFFNINKPSGTEEKGGGQSYIDISTSAVSLKDWAEFFQGVTPFSKSGRQGWTPSVYSLGDKVGPQALTIQERRDVTVSIREQKLLSRRSNRVYAWHPDHNAFPVPENPAVSSRVYDLHVYIAKLANGQYWAGWFQKSQPEPTWTVDSQLNQMFLKEEGYLKFRGDVVFDPNDSEWPFRKTGETPDRNLGPVTPKAAAKRAVDAEVLFDEDEGSVENASPKVKEAVRVIRIRNTKAVGQLKRLYQNKCQISGVKYTFSKKDGELYSEAHHLIPLGQGGADLPHNIVILSPLHHRMLHHAKVEGLDLKKIRGGRLEIKINGEAHVITWHPDHAKVVEKFNP